MEIFGRAAAALARRAARTMQLGGAVIFGAVERDQHVIAQPAEGCEPATSLHRNSSSNCDAPLPTIVFGRHGRIFHGRDGAGAHPTFVCSINSGDGNWDS